jgi:FeS assembly SUF system protein
MDDTARDIIDLKASAPAPAGAAHEHAHEGACGCGHEEAAKEESSIPPAELERLTADIIAALKSVYDPEIPVDIYELGLIYGVDISDDFDVSIQMTLTAPACPVAGEMPQWVENAVEAVPGVRGAEVNMVFDPPWTPERMSDEARLELGML